MTEQEIIDIVQNWFDTNVQKTKVSQLPLSEGLEGLMTLGVDSLGNSVKVSLQSLQDAIEDASEAYNNWQKEW